MKGCHKLSQCPRHYAHYTRRECQFNVGNPWEKKGSEFPSYFPLTFTIFMIVSGIKTSDLLKRLFNMMEAFADRMTTLENQK